MGTMENKTTVDEGPQTVDVASRIGTFRWGACKMCRQVQPCLVRLLVENEMETPNVHVVKGEIYCTAFSKKAVRRRGA